MSEQAQTKRASGLMGSILRIVNWKGPTNEPLVDVDRLTGEKFALFGKYNLFPELLRGLTYNAAPLKTCVDTMTQFVAGEGVEFLVDDDKPDEKAAKLWAQLTFGSPDIIEEIAYNLVLMNARPWEIIYTGGGKIIEVASIDGVRLRAEKKDAEGVIPNWYWCDDWEKFGKDRTKYQAVPIPSFDVAGRKPKAIMYRRGQGNDYYPFPKWIAAMTDAEVWSRIPVFNRTQIDTGFRPAAHIHVFTNKDESQLTNLKREIEELLTGADAQTYAVTHGPTVEGAPVINKLERGDHAGELDNIGNRAELVIYKAFGLPPLLAGVDVNTGMSGKGLAIEQTLTMFQRTRIMPEQKLICRDIREIMRAAGYEPNIIRIKQLSPFDAATDQVLNRQTYLARTTVNQDLIANGKQPLPKGDKRGDMLLIEMLRGSVAATNDPAQTV